MSGCQPVSLTPPAWCQGSDVIPMQLSSCRKTASQVLCSVPASHDCAATLRTRRAPFQYFPALPDLLGQALDCVVIAPVSLCTSPATSGKWLNVGGVPKGLGDRGTHSLCYSLSYVILGKLRNFSEHLSFPVSKEDFMSTLQGGGFD